MGKKRTVIIGSVLVAFIMFVGFWYSKPQILKEHNNINKGDSNTVPTAGVTFAMDTFVEQKWYGENSALVYNMINSLIADTENMLSYHKQDSEIFNINKNAGIKPVEISEECFDFLVKAKELSVSYNDFFDITIAPVTSLWGVNSDTPKRPDLEQLSAAMALMGIDQLSLYKEGTTFYAYLEKAGMAIDLGGIAKGYTAEKAMDIAKENGVMGYLSLGGNLGVVGTKPDKTDFKFGVRDPQGTQSDFVSVVTLDGYTMATTGAYERFFEVDGVKYHHVIDPKTGEPALSDLSSVTVISKDGALADALSTAFFVAGEEYAKDNLNNEEYALIIIDKDNKIYVSPWFLENFELNRDNTNYKLV